MLTRYKQKAPGLKLGRFLFYRFEVRELKLDSKHRCRA